MGRKKKPFIDKKSAHSFQLVHRSQRDPLQADEDSSKRVLLPQTNPNQERAEGSSSIQEVGPEFRKEYGIYFDDDYDYMQHLKTRTDTTLEPLPDNVFVLESKNAEAKKDLKFGNVSLPSEAFPSAFEEDEGLLNLAAPISGPRPDLDPDIVAALDDALDLDDPNNILDDDFVVMANSNEIQEEPKRFCGGLKGAYNELFEGDQFSDDDDDDDYEADSDDDDDDDDDDAVSSNFSEEETKSKFTSYSMTSSVIRRNEGLTLLDDRFDKIMEDYDEDEIGALDHEFVSGIIDPNDNLLSQVTEEFINQQRTTALADISESKKESSTKEESSTQKEEDVSDEDGEEIVTITEKPKDQWDCESILSTYSTLYNHPTLIKEPSKKETITLSRKSGLPVGVLSSRGKKNEEETEAKTTADKKLTNTRIKGENPEEKKLRKKAVKEERRDRRAEKKANKVLFKSEMKRQEKALINNKVQQNVKL